MVLERNSDRRQPPRGGGSNPPSDPGDGDNSDNASDVPRRRRRNRNQNVATTRNNLVSNIGDTIREWIIVKKLDTTSLPMVKNLENIVDESKALLKEAWKKNVYIDHFTYTDHKNAQVTTDNIDRLLTLLWKRKSQMNTEKRIR